MAHCDADIRFEDRNAGLPVDQSFAPSNAEIHIPPGRFVPGRVARCAQSETADRDFTLELPETPPKPTHMMLFAFPLQMLVTSSLGLARHIPKKISFHRLLSFISPRMLSASIWTDHGEGARLTVSTRPPLK
jgi:hypothetical protein